MSDKKITAVDYIALKLYEMMEMRGDGRVFDEIVEHAKQMEKQQIIDAYIKDNTSYFPKKQRLENAEEYYTETYGK